MSDWRGKDDLDLTADDVGAMLDARSEVDINNDPRLPGAARLVHAYPTYGGRPQSLHVTNVSGHELHVTQPLSA